MTNDIISLYQNWQTEEGLLGTAIVDEIVSDGLPFILDEEKDFEQKVFNYKVVKVTWIELTELGKSRVHKENSIFKKRYLDNIGLTTSRSSLNKPENQLVDKFITIHGISVF